MKPYLVVFKALSFGVAGNAAIDAVPCSVAQSCLALWNPIGFNPTGTSVHGIFQAVILEWVAISFPEDLLDPGIKPTSPMSSVLVGESFTTTPLGKPIDT